ncbi:MAG: WecB/TagA/CpsF family glycosyltransferase [Verrucomicrobiales bacterium]|nr:WecB/TagA/CpsF family glycosyltransferase [Verrucomicrobiales bacterium]
MARKFQTVPVLGTPLAVVDYQEAASWIVESALETVRPLPVAAANTMVVTLARHDPHYRETLAPFAMVTPDGMPLVWCLNRRLPRGRKLKDRVYGPSLMLAVFAATEKCAGIRHFLLGGTEDTLVKLEANLRHRFPNSKIAGVFSPPFGEWTAEVHGDILRRIKASGANVTWIGLGCPKQENWLAAHLRELPPGVYPAVGAAFAFHAGKVKQAPRWMQRCGLEWAFRLWSEPRRLFTRYLKFNSLFIYYLIRDALWRSKTPSSPTCNPTP